MDKGNNNGFRPGTSLILATDSKFNIGNDGKLLFWIPEDLKRFKEMTMGKNLYMGRVTFESTGPLEGRKMIVLSRQDIPRADLVINDKEEFREKMINDENGMLIGGGSMVEMFYSSINYIYLTVAKGIFDADTRIADPLTKGFKIVNQSSWYNYEGLEYRYVDYRRID